MKNSLHLILRTSLNIACFYKIECLYINSLFYIKLHCFQKTKKTLPGQFSVFYCFYKKREGMTIKARREKEMLEKILKTEFGVLNEGIKRRSQSFLSLLLVLITASYIAIPNKVSENEKKELIESTGLMAFNQLQFA